MQDKSAQVGGVDQAAAGRAAELLCVPLGLLRLDIGGRILHYNPTPEHGPTHAADELVGRNFFEELVHCQHVQEFREQYAAGVRRRDLFASFGDCCTCPQGSQDVRITLYYSRVSDTAWALVERIHH